MLFNLLWKSCNRYGSNWVPQRPPVFLITLTHTQMDYEAYLGLVPSRCQVTILRWPFTLEVNEALAQMSRSFLGIASMWPFEYIGIA
jgi:hypothetical protein